MSSIKFYSCRSPRIIFILIIIILFFFRVQILSQIPHFLDWFRDHQPPARTCISFNSNGCPITQVTTSRNCPLKKEIHDAPDMASRPIFDDCRHPIDQGEEDIDEIDRCRETFGEWFASRFSQQDPSLFIISSSMMGFLSDASCVLLLRDVETLQRLINHHTFCKPPFLSMSANFTTDLHNEIRDAIVIYFSAYWQSHPFFRKTLPDNHFLFTPPESLIDSRRTVWREELKANILSTGQSIPRNLRRPRLLIIAGGGASGKSSVLSVLKNKRRLIPPGAHIAINPDNIKLLDPIYQAITSYGDMRAANVVHKESNIIAEELFLEALKRRYEIIYEGTFSDFEKGSRMVNMAHDQGYDVVMIGVIVDPALAVRRSLERAVRSKRVVPSHDLLRAHKLFSQNFERYLQIVDKALLCETYRDDETTSTTINVLASMGTSRRLRVFNDEAYREFLDKSTLNEFAQWEYELDLNEGQGSSSLDRLDMQKWFHRCTWSHSQVPRYFRIISVVDGRIDYCFCHPKFEDYPTSEGLSSFPSFFGAKRKILAPLVVLDAIPKSETGDTLVRFEKGNHKKRRQILRKRRRSHSNE
eukprot:TRINITY_DN18118_c0_g1_i1.p1 TRINITY_DN18118_c0_g1~~TRINITY_DN18118_c0_g1_i1.p1  ORF type:complete len:585 (+),score=70.79 TRINITY_DN18118_c0_g1_i1:74-1828(+)